MVRVKIDQGLLVGGKCTTSKGNDYFEFLQIPYAEPPIGELRFKSPKPPKPWQGERDVTVINPDKVGKQTDASSSISLGSEDCLYLNVSTPKLPPVDPFQPVPVMVFIHGGGFVMGNGTSKELNKPDHLLDNNVVVVTINYRLNVFGFLSLDIPEAAGNMGLKDQVQALKWVRDNISAFGGDFNNVTVFGQSAGAASVEYHLLSQKSKGLFSKAILQSGSVMNPWASQYNIVDLSVKVALSLGYKGCATDMKAIHAFLMEQPSEALGIKAFQTVATSGVKGLYFGFVPSIEKDFGNGEAFLTQHPYEILDQGTFSKVPTIRGFCDLEAILTEALCLKDYKKLEADKKFTEFFMYPLSSQDKELYNRKLFMEYLKGKDNAEEVEAGVVEFFGHHDFVAGVMLATKKALQHGADHCFLYRFSYDSPNSMVRLIYKLTRKGAGHGADLGWTLGMDFGGAQGEVKAFEADAIITNRMCKMWTDFAKTGNPTPTSDELIPLKWPAYNTEDQPYLVIDTQMTIEKEYEPTKMAVFEEIYDKYRK